MPWWIDDTNTDPISMNICLWNSLPSNYRDELRAQLLILFPETVSSDYGNAALWLASAKGIVNPSMRDLFTAGGRVRSIAGSSFQEGLPKIWLTLSRYYDIIITYLIPNSPILPYIKEYNPELAKSTNMYNQWLKQIDKRLGSVVIDHVEYSIKEVLENKMLNCVSDD